MRHASRAVLIAVVAIAVLTACQRKDKPPTPTVSMGPAVQMTA